MKLLPVTPVETLATVRAAAPTSHNPGIVPPWLQHPERNRNPGIVPPWLQGRPVGPTHPVADDVPRILGIAQPTVYEPNPIVVDPETPRIWRA